MDKYLDTFLSLLCAFLNKAASFLEINTEILTAIATFETAILAFLIPLSIEIISKLSERYSSEVITREFESHWVANWFPIFLLLGIAGAVILILFYRHHESLVWKLFALVELIQFLISIIATWKTVTRMRLFMSNIEEVINQLEMRAGDSIE